MTKILLMNPNSNGQTTEAMCDIAATVLRSRPLGWTAPAGPRLLTTPAALDQAAEQIAAAEIPSAVDLVIVAAFGDPGAEALSQRLDCPVIGIGAAASRAAARAGTAFAVVTTTPALEHRIDMLMRRHAGDVAYAGCYFTDGEPGALMADQDALDRALAGAILRACEDGAGGVIVGGGPLGTAAERLRAQAPVRLYNPVLCAAQEAAASAEEIL